MMRLLPYRWLMVAGGLVVLAGSAFSEPNLVALDQNVHQFIKTYCIKCHGPDEDKGDYVLHDFFSRQNDQWMIDVGDIENVHVLQDVLDQLNLGEMPPDKKGVQQPKSDEVKETTEWLTDTLLALEEGNRSNITVLRRLNRTEYRNTIRDLLGLDGLTRDLTSNFPADEDYHGFTNVGEALNLSDAHLEAYLEAADAYLRMAFHFGDSPKPRQISFRPQSWGYAEKSSVTPWMYRIATPNQFLDIGAGAKQLSEKFDLGTYPKIFARNGGIRQAGYYRITIHAEAIRRLTHPYDPAMIPTDLTPPMQLGLYISDGTKGLAAAGVKSRTKVGWWDLEDHEVKDLQVTVWLDEGAIPMINWDNGPGPSDYWMRDILIKYHKDVEFRGKQGAHAWHIKPDTAVPGRIVSDVWQGPMIRVHAFEMNGPLWRTSKSKAKIQFAGDVNDIEELNLSEALRKFTFRAFRRPIGPKDYQPYVRLAEQAVTDLKRSPEEAFYMALKAVLVSPDFLYLKETGDEDGKLSSWEMANRLSYFLWSSMPDQELLSLAQKDELLKPAVIRQQVHRMLRDPNSKALTEGFATSWLRLDKLGSMPADQLKFQEYFQHGLEEAMRTETFQFVENAIDTNAPLTDFLDSDYAFLNQDLARHYGIDGVQGIHFRRVSLPQDSHRGGLLGQASILTLSANGIDTSPVVRGIWILENLMGTPPPPPPPDVEPLDPDVRGATTIKQRLARHSEIESCADCHAKIDPYGFPLEYFDPIGGYRETYFRNRRWNRLERKTVFQPGRPVDGASELRSGERFSNPTELKQVLLDRKETFATGLAEKLLTYAAGRPMTYRDHPELKAIADRALQPGQGFRNLILDVATSEVFRSR
ncbi:MAG: DUF1592 domain-containing protein [Verrucomicrobiota bacterium]